MHPIALDPDDLPPDDDKARAALARYRLAVADDAGEPDVAAAYALLDAEFGAKGELESMDALRAYFARAAGPDEGYKLVVARDRDDGAIAAIRDCHVSVDRRSGLAVAYLAHVLVLPPHRRSGLAALLRAAPVAFGRRALRAAGLDPAAADLLLAAEMERPVAGAADTVARLVAYGRAGFAAIDPGCLPYAQPDYRPHRVIDADRLRPIPLLAVVRWVGHEDARALPKRLAAAFVEHVYAALSAHCRAADLAVPRAATLAKLATSPEPVPLLELPKAPDDVERIAALGSTV